MNFKITKIEKIKKHAEFDTDYMQNLHVCRLFITPDEKKRGDYCFYHCKNECYKKQKFYFEQYVCMIRNPQTMYLEYVKGEITYVKPTEMLARYKEIDIFLNKWLKDTKKKVFSKLDFYPDISQCPEDVYNIFNGFSIEKIDLEQKEKDELIKPILQHFKDCFESEEVVNYIIRQFAHTIKYPMDKSSNGVSVVIQGEQGTGKSFTIDEMLIPLIGEKYYTYTCKPSDLAGDHSEAMTNKLVVTLDEVNGKTSFDIAEVLKSFITQTKLIVNPKGIRPYTVNNWCRYWFTTNRKVPLKIEIGDRRYFATRMLETHKNDIAYYKNLSTYMKRKDVLSAWFDYLNSQDVKDYDFKSNRPYSKIYSEMIEASVSNITKFLHDFALPLMTEEDKTYYISATEFFKKYCDWKERTKHKDEYTSTAFGRDISSHQGISKKRETQGFIYKIDIEEIINYFKKNNLFGYHVKDLEIEISEVDKLRAIIKEQQKEILELKAKLENKQSKHTINIDYDSDDDRDIKITYDIFKKTKSIKGDDKVRKEGNIYVNIETDEKYDPDEDKPTICDDKYNIYNDFNNERKYFDI